jgi:GNAT superfamily N-acetyltransferase
MHEMFSNPFFHALRTEHAGMAIGSPLALRYPADVIPFAALAESSTEAMAALSRMLAPGETIYVTGDSLPAVPQIERLKELPGWQFHFPSGSLPAAASEATTTSPIRLLTEDDAPAMVALTDVAFPGFFRARTYLLGSYFGVHIDGELIAMGGERVSLPGYREISALCTHPGHTGRGHAAALTHQLLRAHAESGLRSFLHVLAANHRAIALYERLGFRKTIPMMFNQIRRRQVL